MKIHVYGTDLTAWTAAACLAKVGNEVIIIEWGANTDLALDQVAALKNEPGLYALAEAMIQTGSLSRCTDFQDSPPEVHWLALKPTEEQSAIAISKHIAESQSNHTLVINQCNFGAGSTDLLQSHLDSTINQAVVFIPDYLQEGQAIAGFMTPQTLALGSENQWGLGVAKALMRPFSAQVERTQVMSAREAEFTKLAITGMLALRLGYVNELANLAENFNVDIEVIRDSMGSDPRIGRHYLFPGCGFGGLNFHQYLSRFTDIAEQFRAPSLVKAVMEQNEVQKDILFRKLWQFYQGDIQGKTVSIWGAAFKPDTASIDNGPCLTLIDALLAQSVNIHIHDPQALANIKQRYASHPKAELIHYHTDKYSALDNSDALLVVTQWSEYLSPDYPSIARLMAQPLLIDGRNIYDKNLLNQYQINYRGIGR